MKNLNKKKKKTGTPKFVCLSSKHGEHHTKLVLRQRPINAGLKLPIPNGRCCHPSLKPPFRPPSFKVPTHPHRPNSQRVRRQMLQLRFPTRRRHRACRRTSLQRLNGRGWRSSENKHHNARPTGPPNVRTTAVLRNTGSQENLQNQENKAVHPGFQAGVRAFLHPRGRAGGVGRTGEEP